jgi:hypothetical protein
MNSAFFFLTTLVPIGVFTSNPAKPALVFDVRDVSRSLDAGISKKTPVSKSAQQLRLTKSNDSEARADSIANIFPKGNATHRRHVLIDDCLLICSRRAFLDFTSNYGYFLRGVIWQKDNSL